MYWVDIVCCTGCAVSDEKAQDLGLKGRAVKVGWYENGTERIMIGLKPLCYRGWRFSPYHPS